MMTKILRTIILSAVLLAALPAGASFYLCGAFNGWNAAEAVELTPGADGVYAGTIDFGAGVEFKMSTVRGDWNAFDTGTYAITGDVTVTADTWLPIEAQPTSGNCRAPGQQSYQVMVDLDNLRIKFSTGGSAATPYSGTIPVLFINTKDNAPVNSKETYVDATYYLDPMGVEGVKAVGTAEAPDTLKIKGRGNYTWTGFEKKPYRLKLTNKTALLGMPKSKNWALLANADDSNGFMRNFTGFSLSKMLDMPWTPDSEPCEVMLNGNYIGLYFLTETVSIDKNRVNIVEQADEATTDVDGGWLVEIDNYDSDPHVTVTEGGDNDNYQIWFTYKSPEVLSAQQENYLQTAMNNINNAIYNVTERTWAAPRLAELVDLNIAARFYLANEIVDNCESYHGSCYLNRNRGAEYKWMFGPVWDFGNAFNRGASQAFIFSDPAFHQVWIGGIYKFDAFRTVLADVWGAFLRNGGEADIDARMSAFADYIAAAAACDARRWPQYGNANEVSRANTARGYVSSKIAWLKSQWGLGGVEAMTVASQAGEAVYYNLSGVRVDATRLLPGVYVRVTDGKAVKVTVR